MKSSFSKSGGWLRTISLLPLIGLMLSPFMAEGADPSHNTGIVAYYSDRYADTYFTTDPFGNQVSYLPSVDSVDFVNSGIWDVYTAYPYADYSLGVSLPYATANTLNFTNTGTMTGSVGWEFDYGQTSAGGTVPGGRGMANMFYNAGTIESVDGSIYNPNLNQYLYSVSYLWVSATNIVNKGLLKAGPNGEIVLNGANVVLSRSALQIGAVAAAGSFNANTNYFPDTAIYPQYWGEGLTNVDTPLLWQTAGSGTNITAAFPNQEVTDPCGNSNSAPQLVFTPSFYSWTDTPDPNSITNLTTNGPAATTRYFRQAVFVVVNNNSDYVTNNSVTNSLIRYMGSGNPTNLFKTVTVWLHSADAGDLYVIDTLGSRTNRGVLLNSVSDPASGTMPPGSNPRTPCTGRTYRPANYTVERVDNSFTNGSSGNVTVPAYNFLYDSSFSNITTIADVSAYEAYVDDLAYDPYGSSVSNLPGRIIINADNLDLSRAVITNPGPEVVINAKNLTNSPNAAISCQNISYNLGSSSGTVLMQNVATNGTLPAVNGTLSLWSALWTNFMPVPYIISTTNGPVTTNVATELDFHVLLVDARRVSSTVPVRVRGLTLQTNAVINDSMTVTNTFSFAGQSLTLNGALSFSGGNLQNWNSALAPYLLYFTNNGSLYIPNEAHFGDDTAVPYAEFVNNGLIVASGQTIDSLDLQLNNALNFTFTGNFSAMARSVEITGTWTGGFPYSIYSAGNLQFYADTLQLNQAGLFANGPLDFMVTNSLSDNGTASAFTCYNGFNLWVAPQTGNLLGTSISNVAPSSPFGVGPEIDNAWAGVDYGLSGWSSATNDNAPIGDLILVAQAPSQIPTFHFYGTGGAPSNALYVTTLDLSQLTSNPGDLASMIQIDPGMKIYCSQVILGFTPPGGYTPQQYVQLLFPGQIESVPNQVVTQNSSVDWNDVHQRIDGFGGGVVFLDAGLDPVTDANMDTLFGNNTNQLSLSLIRVRISPYGLASWSIALADGQKAMARGARILATPWTPPASMKDNGNIVGGSLLPSEYGNYANYLNDFAAYMKTNGAPLAAISIQNEPDANVNYESCVWTPAQLEAFCHTNAVAITNAPVMMPESQSFTTSYSDPTLNDPVAVTNVAIIGGHLYGVSTIVDYPNAHNKGKPTWMTEYLVNDQSLGSALATAEQIYDCLTVGNMSAYIWWKCLGNANGLVDASGVPQKRGFVMAQFSRFVRPGFVRIGASTSGNDLLVTAFKDTNSQNFAIVAINPNINIDVTETFSLNNFSAVSAVTPWMTSFSDSLAQKPDVAVSGSSFTYTVPAQSVVTFVNQGYGGGGAVLSPGIVISSTAYTPGGPGFVLTWNSTKGATYSVLKSSVLTGSPTGWSPVVTNYPAGGAMGGPLSYTDTTAAVSSSFYRIKSEQQVTQ